MSIRHQAKKLAREGAVRLADALLPLGSLRRRRAEQWLVHRLRDLYAQLTIRTQRLLHRQQDAGPRPRVLYILHDAAGGIRETTKDLLSAIHPRFECFLLTATPSRLALLRYTPYGLEPLQSWWLSSPWSHRLSRDEQHGHVYRTVLDRLDPDLVHVRHLLGHTDELIELCHERGSPILLSFHDYYMACPGIHLLDDRDRYCAGHCTPSRGQCRIPVPWLHDLPVLKAGYLESWRDRVREMMPRMAAFVTTSQASRDVLLGVYPELAERDFRVIEHGRDFPAQEQLASFLLPGGPVRVALPGHLHFHKGSDFVRRLKEYDRDRENLLELHFLGTTDPSLRDLGVHHGPYPRSRLSSLVAAIRPSFVGIFSIWPETYCHTLTEAWSVSIPVFASDLGALRKRVRAHGGGWTIPVDDIERAYQEIVRVVRDPDEYRREAGRARIDREMTVTAMGRSYEQLYEDLLGAQAEGENPHSSRKTSATRRSRG